MSPKPLSSDVVNLAERPSGGCECVVADIHSWSEASRIVLVDVADGLRRLEERGTDVRHLARFRWSLFKALRELHAIEDASPRSAESSI